MQKYILDEKQKLILRAVIEKQIQGNDIQNKHFRVSSNNRFDAFVIDLNPISEFSKISKAWGFSDEKSCQLELNELFISLLRSDDGAYGYDRRSNYQMAYCNRLKELGWAEEVGNYSGFCRIKLTQYGTNAFLKKIALDVISERAHDSELHKRLLYLSGDAVPVNGFHNHIWQDQAGTSKPLIAFNSGMENLSPQELLSLAGEFGTGPSVDNNISFN